MYIALAALIALHGLAHMVGFAAPFGYMKEAPPMDLFFGRVVLPESATKAIGILWLLTVIAFVTASVGIIRHSSWWMPLTIGAIVVSIVLTTAFLPYAKLGLAFNFMLIAFLVLNRTSNWVQAA